MCKYFLYSCNCLWVTQCHVCILLKERIFFLHVYPQLNFFKFGLCVFIFPYLLNFPQNCFFPKLVLFFLFLQGENFFLTFVVLRGSCCSSQKELSLFSLTLLHMFSVYLLIRQSLSIRDKKGETQMTCLFCLGGEYRNFLMYLTQGENQFTFFSLILCFILLFICLSFHTCVDVFVECFKKNRCILIKTFYLLLATSRLGVLDWDL